MSSEDAVKPTKNSINFIQCPPWSSGLANSCSPSFRSSLSPTTMPFLFCSAKVQADRNIPYSWYWSGKPIREGYKRGEYIREVRTDVCGPAPPSYYSDHRYSYRERKHHCQHVYNSCEPPKYQCSPTRCYHPPVGLGWCQQGGYYESRRCCSGF